MFEVCDPLSVRPCRPRERLLSLPLFISQVSWEGELAPNISGGSWRAFLQGGYLEDSKGKPQMPLGG